jgi:hypothetical protein
MSSEQYQRIAAARERQQRLEAARAATLLPADVDWKGISPNSFAIGQLLANPARIHWKEFSGNPAPEAIDLMRRTLEKVDFWELSGNSAGIGLLRANIARVDWDNLLTNANGHELFREHPEQHAAAVRRHNSRVWSLYVFHSPRGASAALPLLRGLKSNR